MRDFSQSYTEFPRFYEPARRVMAAFGKAMWHFAQLKEIIWYEVGYENVKEFFHHMEHSYGEHIDNYKLLMAQVGLPLLYPDIPGMSMENRGLAECFDIGIRLIDSVNEALSDFIEATDLDRFEPLARQAENIQMANYKPRAVMLQARTMANNGGGSATSFDNWFKDMIGDDYG